MRAIRQCGCTDCKGRHCLTACTTATLYILSRLRVEKKVCQTGRFCCFQWAGVLGLVAVTPLLAMQICRLGTVCAQPTSELLWRDPGLDVNHCSGRHPWRNYSLSLDRRQPSIHSIPSDVCLRSANPPLTLLYCSLR